MGYMVALSVLATITGIFSAGFGAIYIMYIGLLAGGGAVAGTNSAVCQN